MKSFLKESGGNEKPPALKDLPRKDTLRVGQAWETLFQQQLPRRSILEEFVVGLGDFYVNIRLGIEMAAIERSLHELTGTELKAENIMAIPFVRNTEPIDGVRSFLTTSFPMAIRLSDEEEVRQLDRELRVAGVLKDEGEMAGSIVTWTKRTIFEKKFKGTIISGVVDRETNKPLGLMLCPDDMLKYEFIDTIDIPRKRRKEKRITLGSLEPAPGNLEI